MIRVIQQKDMAFLQEFLIGQWETHYGCHVMHSQHLLSVVSECLQKHALASAQERVMRVILRELDPEGGRKRHAFHIAPTDEPIDAIYLTHIPRNTDNDYAEQYRRI